MLALIQKHTLPATAAGVGASALSLLEQLGPWLRVASGIGGFVVVVLSVWIKLLELRKLKRNV
jgi:hypothetical protein